MKRGDIIKNNYKIQKDLTIIYLHKSNNEILECKIDTEDLELVSNIKGTWSPKFSEDSDSYYASYCEHLGMEDGKQKKKIHYMHRSITNPNKNQYVDHINHDTIDNRKENLRVSKNDENTKNRKTKNSNNTSGYRNVSKIGKWWVVQLQINGKNTHLKKFPLDQLEEAGAFAKEMREKYYGEFQGNN